MFEPDPAEAAHWVALRRLQNAYADVVTRHAWDELGDLFTPDAVVEVDTRTDKVDLHGPAALGEFIARAIERFEFFEFMILNTRLEIGAGDDPTRATGRMYMCELRQERDTGRWSNAYGVYHDNFRLVDGRWWFTRRRYHSLARTARDFDVFDFPHHLSLDSL